MQSIWEWYTYKLEDVQPSPFFPTIIVQCIQDYVGKIIQALVIVEERGSIGLYELVIEKNIWKVVVAPS